MPHGNNECARKEYTGTNESGKVNGGGDEERPLYGRCLVIGSEWEVPPGGLNRKRSAPRTVIHIGSRIRHTHLTDGKRP